MRDEALALGLMGANRHQELEHVGRDLWEMPEEPMGAEDLRTETSGEGILPDHQPASTKGSDRTPSEPEDQEVGNLVIPGLFSANPGHRPIGVFPRGSEVCP